MSKVRQFGAFRPRLNILPLLLTPGIWAVGCAIGGAQAGLWVVAAWLAIVLGAVVSCAVHAFAGQAAGDVRGGRQAFDYDPNIPG